MNMNPKEHLVGVLSGEIKEPLINEWEPFTLLMSDPVNTYLRETRVKGQITYDRFGTAFIWPEDQVSGMPHITEDNKVIPDITDWKSFLKVPDFYASQL